MNTQLHNRDGLHISEVAYLSTIEASKTELNTVNTILSRSLEIADILDLNTVMIVIRLGGFHTYMSFMSIPGKRFRDTGLIDILIELWQQVQSIE